MVLHAALHCCIHGLASIIHETTCIQTKERKKTISLLHGNKLFSFSNSFQLLLLSLSLVTSHTHERLWSPRLLRLSFSATTLFHIMHIYISRVLYSPLLIQILMSGWKYCNVPIVFRSSVLRRNSKLTCHAILLSLYLAYTQFFGTNNKNNTNVPALRVAPIDPTRNAFLLSHLSSLVPSPHHHLISHFIIIFFFLVPRIARVTIHVGHRHEECARGNTKKKQIIIIINKSQ